MDKQQEAQVDSISSVGVQIKPDYPPSEVYSSEPPPAYQRPRHTAVQIARIAAVTLVAVSFILGLSIVASAYVTAMATCYQESPPGHEQLEDRPLYQALVDPLDSEETSHNKRESEPQDNHLTEEPSDDQPIRIRLPLQLDFDELAGSMIEKNQRSRMNCVVEKRRAEEVMDHQPKTVNLPFGVNLTTDPRFERVTGERMAIFCETGNDQRRAPMEQEQKPPMVQMQVVPIQLQPMQFHPNVGPHPMNYRHQMPQQSGRFPHIVHPRMNHPHGAVPMGLHMTEQVQQHREVHPQFSNEVHPQFSNEVNSQFSNEVNEVPDLPPQVLQVLQQHLAAEQMAQRQQMTQENRRIPHMAPGSSNQVFIQEEIIPIPHPQAHLRPEGRSMEGHPVLQAIGAAQEHPVPSDTVRPPPPPSYPNEHILHPRSVRDVSSIFKKEKRVRRCACNCSC